MRIATLQFNPQVGQIAANFSRAESLLMREEREGVLRDLDLLVLPELAFTGYNHPSLSAIAPYLEPTAAGPSTRWAARTALRLKCTVAVGYPEAAEEGNFNTAYDAKITAEEGTVAYNALVIVDSTGEVVAHYRKSFLYYTDETWAQEGQGFFAGVLPMGAAGHRMKAVAGICMDINPYKFEAPWTAYEFANHARESRAKIVILSMAWLTHLTADDLAEQVMLPDTSTVGYWAERFRPLMNSTTGADDEVIIVCANRVGIEGTCPRIGQVKYAGSSCVFSMMKGQDVRIWDISGRSQEGVLLVDTNNRPGFSIAPQEKAETIGGPMDGQTQAAVDQAAEQKPASDD
ncbi:uncharacterized protein HMPREF1541_04912 [Cyphellophora europaea CBS 101466]|uniref:CN hydrolase domain-containing protein n=1 Tax=Cyphellophora europaea (strain CBS 101466) TaxID=1220924 RepID=W2RXX5_CYPE1|nr:uncharacterized protein HMPREF1541_04912 [Cyphellophora europaea CBS 101466]ETN40633.1 hypothetical protein HMPREF1541_04912 [Cyphellophora europaea CBS 101466]